MRPASTVVKANFNISMTKALRDKIDALRAPESKSRVLAGRDRSAAIEILLRRGMKAGR